MLTARDSYIDSKTVLQSSRKINMLHHGYIICIFKYFFKHKDAFNKYIYIYIYVAGRNNIFFIIKIL